MEEFHCVLCMIRYVVFDSDDGLIKLAKCVCCSSDGSPTPSRACAISDYNRFILSEANKFLLFHDGVN